jgi:predicted nucleotidyltransferase
VYVNPSSVNIPPKEFLEPNCVIQIGNIPNRIDILTDIDGLDFENSWQNKNKIDFDGLSTYSLSLDDLIINKSSTKRAKDKLDLEQLKELSKISK